MAQSILHKHNYNYLVCSIIYRFQLFYDIFRVKIEVFRLGLVQIRAFFYFYNPLPRNKNHRLCKILNNKQIDLLIEFYSFYCVSMI